MAVGKTAPFAVGDIYKCGLGRLFMVVHSPTYGAGAMLLCIRGPGKAGEADTPGWLYNGPPSEHWTKVGHFDGL